MGGGEDLEPFFFPALDVLAADLGGEDVAFGLAGYRG